MRILVVQESDWLKKGPHQSHHLMERMTERGHQVRVIDFEILWRATKRDRILSKRTVREGVHKAITGGNVTVIRPPIIRMPILEYLSLVYFHKKEILRQIAEFQPDVIVGFGLLNSSISIRNSRNIGIPFVYYVIDELHRLVPQKSLRRVARLVESSNLRHADLILTINEQLRDYAIHMGAHPEHTHVIRAGVDLSLFKDNGQKRVLKRESLGFSDHELVLFFMGWLYEFSGVLEVSRELVSDDSLRNVRMLVVGSGPLQERLRDLKEKSVNGHRIVLVDWLAYDQIPEHILASDVCILPAHKNPIMMNIVPIKMYEYMAAGKPVISTRLPGIEREFGEGNGVVYVDKPEDTIDAACAIRQRADASRLQSAASDFVRRSDWTRVTDEFEATLRRVIR